MLFLRSDCSEPAVSLVQDDAKSLNDEREVGLNTWSLSDTFLNAELHMEWENVQFC